MVSTADRRSCAAKVRHCYMDRNGRRRHCGHCGDRLVSISAVMASPKVLSSKRGDWQTPRAVIELIEEFNNAPIYLDPCGAPSNPTNADANWFPPKDGLAERWSRDGSLIFVNPPYADIAKWVERISIEASEGAEVILLCAPRTDTSWFRDVWTANVIAFWHGSHQKGCELRASRIQFIDVLTGKPAAGNTSPSVFAYWGERLMRFSRIFAPYARIIFP